MPPSKKRGRKAKEREEEVAQEAALAAEEHGKAERLGATADDDLFVLDKVGSTQKRKRVRRQLGYDKQGKREAKGERVLVERQAKQIKAKRAAGAAGASASPTPSTKKADKSKESAAGGIYDAWGSEAPLAGRKQDGGGGAAAAAAGAAGVAGEQASKGMSSKKRKRVAAKQRVVASIKKPLDAGHPGQSYNPTFEDHQDLVASALALELKRNDAVDRATARKEEMSATTLALLMPDESDDDTSDDDSDEDSEAEGEEGEAGGDGPTAGGSRRKAKAGERITKAQRNKMRRTRQNETVFLKKQALKAKRKEMQRVPEIAEMLTEEEERKRQAREAKKLLEQQTETRIPKDHDLVVKPSIPSSMTAELKGSLRQVKGVGDLLMEHSVKFQEKGLLPDPHKAKRTLAKQRKGRRKKVKVMNRYK